jgi:hypothetical protein
MQLQKTKPEKPMNEEVGMFLLRNVLGMQVVVETILFALFSNIRTAKRAALTSKYCISD